MSSQIAALPAVRSELIARIEGIVSNDANEGYWDQVLQICAHMMVDALGAAAAADAMVNAMDAIPIPNDHQFPPDLYRDSESGLFRAHFFATEYPRYGRGENSLILIRYDPPGDPTSRVNEFAVRIGALVLDSIRTVDVPCRWSRNEFLVLLPRTSVEQAQIVARRIHDASTVREFPDHAISIAVAVAVNSEPIHEVYGRASWSVYHAHVTGSPDISIA